MGRPTSALLTLLFLGLGAAQPAEVIASSPRLTANFDCKLRNGLSGSGFLNPAKLRKLPPGRHVAPPELSLSTVHLCPASAECRPCVRLQIALNTSGFPKLDGFQVHLLNIRSNHFREFRIVKQVNTDAQGTGHDTWQVQYDCFEAEPGSNVSASITTLPQYSVPVTGYHFIRWNDSGPHFSHILDAEKRQINISVPPGPALKARLCYQKLRICEALRNHSIQRIDTSSTLSASLPYDFLVPCLCIEMYYQAPDSKRRKICPFSEHPKAYGVDLWDSARFQDYVSMRVDQMEVGFSFLCHLKPAVALSCIPAEDDDTSCEDIPNSTALETESSLATGSVYTIENVDPNPRLCFKFSLGNSSHFHCPHNRGPVWTVTAEVQLLHLVLTFNTRINTTASFSSTTCTRSEHGQCPPTESIYTVSRASGSSREKLVLILPFQFGESCVLVWRSDVRIAVKELICPDYSRRRDGLLAIAVLAVILLVIVGLLLNYRSLRKAAKAPLWHRTVLLVYSSDSEQFKIAICAFADFLHSTLGCNVILDLWEVGRVTQMGILPWLYSKKELVEREKGKVIVVWTQYSSKLYQLWNSKNTSSGYGADPHNLFGAAMSCLQSDMNTLAGKERLRDYVLVYFDGLCEKQDIPAALKRIPRYRLFKDLHRLVNALQHKTQAPPCWIRARAKFLIQKLVNSDKSTSLQGRLELCRLQQPDGYGWHKEIPETKIDSCLY